MKKPMLTAMAAATLLCFADNTLTGDVNGDGKLTMADATAIVNYLTDNIPDTFNASLADVDGDGSITKADADAIVDIFLGRRTAEEFEEMTGEAMYVSLLDGQTAVLKVEDITSRSLNATKDSFVVSTTGGRFPFALADIKERTYGTMPSRLTVTYAGDGAQIVNPYYATGVSSSAKGGNVTISNTNTSTEYTFELTGSTDNGSLLYNGEYKATIVLNGVNIHNPQGAAIDIECGKRIAVEVKKGTENTLTDGADGTQKAALYCKGHLEFDKAGTLNVTGNTKHAISAKEYIQFKNSTGIINILGAKGDGIHCQQYFLANGFTFNIDNIEGDAIQAEACGDADYDESYPDGSVTIKNGTFNIKANGPGGVKKEESSSTTEEKKDSYVMYFAMPNTGTNTGGMGFPQQSSNYWKAPFYLMNSDGTTKATLSTTVTINGTTFYKYDFGSADSGTYYLKGANYSSSSRPGGSSTSYTIISNTFSGPVSGENYYYQVSNSYTTSGTTRTYTISNVTSQYNGSTSDTSEETGESYNATGIKADGDILILDGNISISNSGAMSKSIKGKGTVQIDGGTLTLNPSGAMMVINNDASYSTAIKAVKAIINGGTITINASGTASRGISAEYVEINDGTVSITNTGNGQQGTNDSYTAKGIKGDNSVVLNGGTITIRMTGTGGKGIKSSGTYTQGRIGGEGPVLTVSTTGTAFGSTSSGNGGWGGMPGGNSSSGSSSKAIKAQGAVNVYGGTSVITTATNGAEGLESKTSVNIAGGTHYFKCYDDCINCSGQINFSGGTTVCYATNNDAVDSNYGRTGAITISGGNVFAYTSAGSPEEGLDCDNNSYITITGGIAVSAGGSQGGGGGGSSSSQSVGSSSQGYFLGSSPSSYGTSYYYTLCNTSGTPICTFKFDANVSNSLSLLTAPTLGKGSVTVKYGTAAPTSCTASVSDASGKPVFFINPTVTTTGTTATVTAK